MFIRLSDRACVALAAALILLAACFRVAFLLHGPFDLAPDEAHYWDWSRHLDFSYYSKGPLVAWVIGGSCELLGSLSEQLTGNLTFAIRAPAVLFGSVLLGCIYVLTVQTARNHPLALAMVAILLAHPAISAGASLMTIDSPYTCFWALALVFTLHAHRTQALWAWAAAGAAVGLGILAKYTMVLFIPCLALFLLTGPSRRGQFFTTGPWLLVGIAALSCLPIVLWNAGHDWVTVRHVGKLAGFGEPGASSSGGLKWLGPVNFALGQVALMLGVWFVLWVCALVAFRPWRDDDEGRQYLWWFSVPVFVLFLGFSLKKGGGEINWPVTAYLSGGVLTAIWASTAFENGSLWQRRLLMAASVFGVLVGVGGVFLMHAPVSMYPVFTAIVGQPRPTNPHPIRKIDPTCRLRGWRELAAAVDRVRDEVARETGEEPVLAGSTWALPGMLGAYCRDNPQAYCLGSGQGERLSQYDMWTNPIDHPDAFRGRTFVVVGVVSDRLQSAFEKREQKPVVVVYAGGQPVAAHSVWVLRGYKGLKRLSGGH